MAEYFTEKAIAKELRERGHYVDDLYHVTMTYAASLWTRLRECQRQVDVIEATYKKEHPDADISDWYFDNEGECEALGDEIVNIEDELEQLFNMVLGFESTVNPFK